ncbi:MAG: adenosine deaminase [Gammaproteobacteria bacterium]|jgi:adenine deaminase|nr:adenosine deaminase [Gammaproteobacteria bacterium]MBT5203931.1 adenosine deaminase [Gammaproteobacteria bacterium]MBT5603157.1 adenosine deaminase [Gammaproteobacteria bacterium]MBT6246634.1 adenosine deaminase [Gammaproteobacteria bacterium]
MSKAGLQFVERAPKAELHVHIEGTLEPDLLLLLAEKNAISLPYRTLDDISRAYQFGDLQSFLDLYYLGASVLVEEDDFYELMWRYLCQCRNEGIVHTEIMFDPQTHIQRGVGLETVLSGFSRAIAKAEQDWQQSVLLILCLLRDLSESEGLQTLRQAKPLLEQITAIGLDSAEVGNPPGKFKQAFKLATDWGLRKVAHAGEEAGPEFIKAALVELGVERIDHGVQCANDPELVLSLAQAKVPLTVCPLSNVRLKVYNDLNQHPILRLLDSGVQVTVNSDDPAYFGGYLMANFNALERALGLTELQSRQLVRNSFTGSFLSEERKTCYLDQLQ